MFNSRLILCLYTCLLITTGLIACDDETTETETQMPVPTNETTAGSETTLNGGIENNSNTNEPENTDALCSDGVDNDGDSYLDCEDFDCSESDTVTVCR